MYTQKYTKKLSIIIPVYNLDKYIAKCLCSIKSYKYINDYEIIIINDGSSDNTDSIIQNFISNHQNFLIKYKKIANHGVSYARNLGIKMSQGENILFIDGDDYLEENCLEKLISILFKEQSDLFYFPFRSIDECSQIKFDDYSNKFLLLNNISGFEALQNKILKKIWICMDNAIYKKNIIDKYNLTFPEEYKIGEDVFFINSYLAICNNVKCIGGIYVNILARKDSAMREKFSEKYFDSVILNIQLKNKFILNNYPKEIIDLMDIDYVNFITDYAKRYITNLKFYEVLKAKNIFREKEIKNIKFNNYFSKKKKLEFKIMLNHKYLYFYIVKIYVFFKKVRRKK